MKALLLVLFFGASGCFLWFSLLCLRMIEYDDGKLNSTRIDELGNWCLVDRQGPGHFRHNREVSIATLSSLNRFLILRGRNGRCFNIRALITNPRFLSFLSYLVE